MLWPPSIRTISLPSVVFGVIFFWNFISYFIFSILSAKKDPAKPVYLYFGLTAFTLAIYSLGTFMLYSSVTAKSVYFWQSWQLMSAIVMFSFFALFSAYYLKNHNRYLKRILPAITLTFIPLFFFPGIILTSLPAPKSFHLGSLQTQILEMEAGPGLVVFFIWAIINLIYLGMIWFRDFGKGKGSWVVPIASVVLIITGFNDLLMTLRILKSVYLLELGFLVSVGAMSFHLFQNYVNTSKQITLKTDQLQAANEEIRFLLHTISHDLNAPAINILGFSNLLIEKGDGFKNRENYLTRIQANAKHMQELIHDLSIYLKINRTQDACDPIDFGKLFKEISFLLDLSNKYPSANLILPSKWPEFKGSAKRLKQIFVNLIENSLKYAAGNALTIIVAVEKQANGIAFSVQDNGPGIPKEMHQKVFETFFRLPSQKSGSGIGLTIVRKIVESYGGEIWIDPEVIAGTKFVFFLPSSRFN